MGKNRVGEFTFTLEKAKIGDHFDCFADYQTAGRNCRMVQKQDFRCTKIQLKLSEE